MEPVISVRDITKSFEGRVVVDHVPLTVKRGQIYGFLGPNGSGKTTFLRILCGLLKADGGEGTCLGYDVIRQSYLIKREIGYMTQRFSLWEDLSIEENLKFIARLYGVADLNGSVRSSLERLGLMPRRRQLAGQLSGGWKQRLALAACLIHQPKLLLLDEPTAGVDPKARRDFWGEIHLLAAEGLTVLITTHYMDEAERCDELAYIAFGKLLTRGTPAEVVERARLAVFELSGPAVHEAALALHGRPGVEQVTQFGIAVHVSGKDGALLADTISSTLPSTVQRHAVPPSLEDVFISLMAEARDNFS